MTRDLAALWEEHCRCEFEVRDATATMSRPSDSRNEFSRIAAIFLSAQITGDPEVIPR
jgi:hypothetical protein